MEQLTLEDMLPTKFHPIARRHFIFVLDGLDSYLVKKVERAPYIRPDQSWKKTDKETLLSELAHQKLVVYLHDPISPCVQHQILELINSKKGHKAHLKFFDPIGTVIGGVTFECVYVERVDYSPMDYDSSDFSEVKLTLSYNSEKPYGYK